MSLKYKDCDMIALIDRAREYSINGNIRYLNNLLVWASFFRSYDTDLIIFLVLLGADINQMPAEEVLHSNNNIPFITFVLEHDYDEYDYIDDEIISDCLLYGNIGAILHKEPRYLVLPGAKAYIDRHNQTYSIILQNLPKELTSIIISYCQYEK